MSFVESIETSSIETRKMFFRSAVRRFRASAVLRVRVLNGFGAFLKATKGGAFPSSPKARAKAVAKAWRALSAAEKANYAKIGKKTVVKPKAKKARKAGPFAKFVKKNFKTVRGTAPQRVQALAKKWKASRK